MSVNAKGNWVVNINVSQVVDICDAYDRGYNNTMNKSEQKNNYPKNSPSSEAYIWGAEQAKEEMGYVSN